MKDLTIKLTGAVNTSAIIVAIDNQPVRLAKNKTGHWVGKCETANDRVNVKVYRLLDVGGAWWFITQLFFFIISIFGLFDVRRRQDCLVIDFEANVNLSTANQITCRVNPPRNMVPAVSVQTDLPYQIVSNQYGLHRPAQRTLRRLKFAKILLTLAAVALTVVLLVK